MQICLDKPINFILVEGVRHWMRGLHNYKTVEYGFHCSTKLEFKYDHINGGAFDVLLQKYIRLFGSYVYILFPG